MALPRVQAPSRAQAGPRRYHSTPSRNTPRRLQRDHEENETRALYRDWARKRDGRPGSRNRTWSREGHRVDRVFARRDSRTVAKDRQFRQPRAYIARRALDPDTLCRALDSILSEGQEEIPDTLSNRGRTHDQPARSQDQTLLSHDSEKAYPRPIDGLEKTYFFEETGKEFVNTPERFSLEQSLDVILKGTALEYPRGNIFQQTPVTYGKLSKFSSGQEERENFFEQARRPPHTLPFKVNTWLPIQQFASVNQPVAQNIKNTNASSHCSSPTYPQQEIVQAPTLRGVDIWQLSDCTPLVKGTTSNGQNASNQFDPRFFTTELSAHQRPYGKSHIQSTVLTNIHQDIYSPRPYELVNPNKRARTTNQIPTASTTGLEDFALSRALDSEEILNTNASGIEMIGRTSAGTQTAVQFLAEVGQLVTRQDGGKLKDFLPIEPQFAPAYNQIIQELRLAFPRPGRNAPLEEEEALEKAVEDMCRPALAQAIESPDGAVWTSFIGFMASYLGYLRDLDVGNLWETYNSLQTLLE